MRQGADLFLQPGNVTELRALEVKNGNRWTDPIVSGYFDNPDALVAEATKLDGHAEAIYAPLNPVNPDLLARANNRVRHRVVKGGTTSDAQIVRRLRMLIDLDAERLAGISSTDEEHDAAIERAEEVMHWLCAEHGFPQPVLADSGNGGHLVFAIDLPADDDGLIERFLQALAARFSYDGIKIDTSVYNPARICKLYGTMACKGDNTPTRPHRRSGIIDQPETLEVVPRELIEAVAALAPKQEAPPKPKAKSKTSPGTFDFHSWVKTHLDVKSGPHPYKDGEKYILETCPFNSDHDRGESIVGQCASGAVYFTCRHQSCQGNKWADLREMKEPGHRERKKNEGPKTADEVVRMWREAHPKSDRPVIAISEDITGVVDSTETAIAALRPGVIYQRAGALVHVVRGAIPPLGLAREPNSPSIKTAPEGYLLEVAGMGATWLGYDARSNGWKPKRPAAWAVNTLVARGRWPSLPVLAGVVESPTLRPDGTVITVAGYDKATGLLYDPGRTVFPPAPDSPTQEQAHAALAELAEVFQDFPFVGDSDLSTAVAVVLTVLARPAIDGPVPLVVYRATTAGTGKSLGADATSVIATGRKAPRMPQANNEEEERKRLLALALEGDPLVLIDNVTRPLGSGALDAALTSCRIKDRVLGSTANAEAPWNAMVIATGNNVVFRGDTGRRVLPIDLDAGVERPEERTGFAHEPLLPWVHENRPRLVVAGLTALRGYLAAGRPRMDIPVMGSFEAWGDLIRGTLVWLGQADPYAGRERIREEGEPELDTLRAALGAWWARWADRPMTVAEAVSELTEQDAGDDAKETLEALAGLDSEYTAGKKISTHRLGNALRKHKGRLVGGLKFASGEKNRAGTRRWRVVEC